MAENSYAIRFEHVTKSFGKQRVLDDISFGVLERTAFCIMGRSGTGKSVTLKQIIGLIKPDRGQIFVEDQEITALSPSELTKVRKKMGFLFQNAALFDSISLGENVAFPLRRHTKLSEEEIRRAVEEKLAMVGLENQYEKMPSELSGGMKKRAGLARALAMQPSILLVDEPSAGLDPITTDEIDELLLHLKESEGVTIVLVTHNIPSARRIGDVLAMLHDGRIVAQGTVAELESSTDPVVQAFMRSEHGG
jgi:phospholipid/cholesterol/gamma-HCH transport system ATP-binding protein